MRNLTVFQIDACAFLTWCH